MGVPGSSRSRVNRGLEGAAAEPLCCLDLDPRPSEVLLAAEIKGGSAWRCDDWNGRVCAGVGQRSYTQGGK